MKRICRRYVFNTKEQFLEKKAVFKDVEKENFVPNNHHIVGIGHELLEVQEIDEIGEVTKEAVYSEKYLADVAWIQNELEYDEENNEHKDPYGWATYRVTPKEPIHSMWGFKGKY